MVVEGSPADPVNRPFEFWARCNAWFITMSYCSIRRPEFMDYQTAIFGAQKIYGFLQMSYHNQHPPLSFFLAAWAATLHTWGEQVRISEGSTLKSLIINTGIWEHRWTNFVPS